MKKVDWKPTTVDECMKAFNEMLTPEEQIEVANMSKDELGRMHHGLGQWIRNNWELWQENTPLCSHMMALGFQHADDMSMSLIEEWWARMNNLPSTMEEDIKKYAEFWEKSRKERGQ
jgi:hypothetical protein